MAHRQRVYVVRSGDTLHKIAKRYSTSINSLLRLNPQITRPDILFIGTPIRLY